MKRRGILHPELMRVIASLGHGETLVIADAGLPIPPEVVRIDLAFAANKPPFLEVVQAVLEELKVEQAILATEIQKTPPQTFHQALLEELKRLGQLADTAVHYLPHEEFKSRVKYARAVVRTGEFTPYANVILHCGVVF